MEDYADILLEAENRYVGDEDYNSDRISEDENMNSDGAWSEDEFDIVHDDFNFDNDQINHDDTNTENNTEDVAGAGIEFDYIGESYLEIINNDDAEDTTFTVAT